MKPNVVFIVADQLRYDFLHKGYTSNIDALLDSSIELERMYTASPLCVPARGALFTGTYPVTNHSLINPWEGPDVKYGYVKQDILDIYQIMESAGYDCFHSGKQHLYKEGVLPQDRDGGTRFLSTEKTYGKFLKDNGFTRPGGKRYRTVCPKLIGNGKTIATSYSNAKTGIYDGPDGAYFDQYFTSCLMEGLKARDKNKPLFISAMYLAPHPPLCIPEKYYDMYQSVPLSDNVGIWCEKQSPLQLYQVTGAIGNGYEKKDWEETWRVYAGLCTLLDDQVKQIIDYLKDNDLYDNSLIIFTTDHGEMLGSHSMFQKMCMYEESSRTVFGIKMPYQKEGRKSDALLSHVDVLPTILQALDLEIPQDVEGKSFLDIVQGNNRVENEDVFIQFDGTDYLGNFARTIVSGDYKLTMDIFKDEVFPELYNVKSDPLEMNNLAFNEENLELCNALLKKLIAHMKDKGDFITLDSFSFVDVKNQYREVFNYD